MFGNGEYPSVTAVVINSRGGHLFQECMASLQKQIYPGRFEIRVVENLKRNRSIGKCWNDAVKECDTDLCVFIGDDDTVNADYIFVLVATLKQAESEINRIGNISTFCTLFDNERESYDNRTPTGMFKRELLLEHPFDESLKRLVDREYLDRIGKMNYANIINNFYYGYRYRQHEGKTSGKYILSHPTDKIDTDIYISYFNNHFIDPIVDEFKQRYDWKIKRSAEFSSPFAMTAKVVWAEFALENAQALALMDIPGKKIVRVHAFEVFDKYLNEVKFDKFDHVIFVSEYIKDFVERNIGKLRNAIVIPNGVQMDKFTIPEGKEQNNNIAYAGYLANKKGAHVLIMLANEFPDFEFHVVGEFQQRDLVDLFDRKKPDNMYLYPWTRDLNSFFADKTYILNCSARESQSMAVMEGMAAGLKPLVYDWAGASDLYPEEYIWRNMTEFYEILDNGVDPEKYRKYIKNNYSFEIMVRRIKNILEPYIWQQEQPESQMSRAIAGH